MHAESNFKHAVPTCGAQVKDEGKSCGVFLTVNKDLLPGVFLALTLHLQAVLKYAKYYTCAPTTIGCIKALVCSLRFGQELIIAAQLSCDSGPFTSYPTRYNL